MQQLRRFDIIGLSPLSRVVPTNMLQFRKTYTENTGNSLFKFAAESLVSYKKNYRVSTDPKKINSESNGIILPLSNHIRSHLDLSKLGLNINEIDVPVIILGIGAQFKLTKNQEKEMNPGTVDWFKSVTKKSTHANISVRGKETQALLKKYGFASSSEVLGCPSLLINENIRLGEKINMKIEKMVRNPSFLNIGIAAGNPMHKHLSMIEKSFIQWVDQYNAKYIVQSPDLLISLSSHFYGDIDRNKMDMLQQQWFSSLTFDEIKSWFSKNSRVYTSLPQWFFDISGLDFVVGTRVHGVQAAIQSGTPGVCLYIDSRTKELCEVMKIPHAPADNYKNGIKIDDVIDLLKTWDYKEFDENRLEIAKKTKKFLHQNNVMTSNHRLMNI